MMSHHNVNIPTLTQYYTYRSRTQHTIIGRADWRCVPQKRKRSVTPHGVTPRNTQSLHSQPATDAQTRKRHARHTKINGAKGAGWYNIRAVRGDTTYIKTDKHAQTTITNAYPKITIFFRGALHSEYEARDIRARIVISVCRPPRSNKRAQIYAQQTAMRAL